MLCDQSLGLESMVNSGLFSTTSYLSDMFHQHTSAMGQPISVRDLASALVVAPSEQRKTMLGEYLHPLVYQLKHENADIVTEMILDMDESEVLHLLESPDALKAEVLKALDKLFTLEHNLAALHALKSRKDNLVSSALARKHTRKEAQFGKIPQEASSIVQPMSITALASALLYAPPEKCKKMLREHLYPAVDQLEHENAAKVTELLLKMDNTEVLSLLDMPEELKAKVSEAMEILRNVEKQTNRPAANTTVSHEDKILDEYVYLVVDQPEHENATEVTRLTPEMNATKVSHLQKSLHALQAKVSEAMEMLTIIQQQTNSLAAQLSSLSYKDNHAS